MVAAVLGDAGQRGGGEAVLPPVPVVVLGQVQAHPGLDKGAAEAGALPVPVDVGAGLGARHLPHGLLELIGGVGLVGDGDPLVGALEGLDETVHVLLLGVLQGADPYGEGALAP